MAKLLDISAGFRRARMLVVGDVLLDRFVYAKVSRISPEALFPFFGLAMKPPAWAVRAMWRATSLRWAPALL